MGTRKNPAGVILQFYDAVGNPSGPARHGQFVEFFGEPQSDVLTRTGPLGPGEHAGSDDWMTLVAVADTEAGLAQILGDWNGGTRIPNTSAASHRVKVAVNLKEFTETVTNRVTIASGLIDHSAMTMDVLLIRVMGEATKMDDAHPMIEEFRKMGPFLT